MEIHSSGFPNFLQPTQNKILDNKVTVAVIDTGISPERLENPVMLPGINLSGQGMADDTTDSGNHGTAIAKTILSIAPDTRLVPIRLMNRRGSLRKREKVEEAFDWILEHRESLGIQIVCAAFADFSHSTSDVEYRGSRLQKQIATLREMNVVTVAPVGNWYQEFRRKSSQGMAWPAIIREVISVGEVERREDGLWLTRRTQRLHVTLGTGCQTTVFTKSGQLGNTSGAAAVVVGKIATLIQTSSLISHTEIIFGLLENQQMASDENGLNWSSVDLESKWGL
ncbi:MAG: S8/S53 family peptidase [Richelia sp. RM2_1_2]|nr:S8/S53 family peptidase [Richelia sp. SM1_7_0]NJN08291.1 S8/S53 family peptidase [Richelia sp. RM1_1_1]NJO26367.1 S8/S53 family peptidase [Richelia sp. SL_2_1]NJO57613.1 S8/S53 family peptidase [Richelia sp. RM2_1_2]